MYANRPQQSQIQPAIDRVRSLKSMSQLMPEDYAPQGKLAELVAQKVAINPTQLRKIFHYVKDLRRTFQKEKFDRGKLALMMPMLAYSRGRDLIPEDFYQLMVLCFSDKCNTSEDFESATRFLEAVMAYHKYYEQCKQKKF